MSLFIFDVYLTLKKKKFLNSFKQKILLLVVKQACKTIYKFFKYVSIKFK